MDLQRYQHDVAAEIPGYPPQLSSLSAVAYNFRHGYSRSSTPPGSQSGGASTICVVSTESHSSYNASQASLSKNSAQRGTGLQISYTYSEPLDDTS